MSAFLVNQLVIADVLAGVRHYNLKHPNTPEIMVQYKTLQEKGDALFNMNELALQARYREPVAGIRFNEVGTALYTDLDTNPVEAAQVTKSIHCFMYQCSEGKVPDSPLYKEIEAVQEYFDTIVDTNSAIYDEAAWDRGD